eukprot:COSAG01_NODE_9448_length_2444_cov_53.780810_2_plen_100_part_00
MAEEEPVLPSAEPEPELELGPGPELEPEPEPQRGESAVVQDPDGAAAGTSPTRMHRKTSMAMAKRCRLWALHPHLRRAVADRCLTRYVLPPPLPCVRNV